MKLFTVVLPLAVACVVAVPAQQAQADVLTTLTHYEATVDGLTVVSEIVYDSINDWNRFHYQVTNNTGHTFFQITFFGQDWVGAVNPPSNWWHEMLDLDPVVDPAQECIQFDEGLLHDGESEGFAGASALTDIWGIGEAEFERTQGGGTLYVPVLKPTAVPEPATLSLLAFGLVALVGRRRGTAESRRDPAGRRCTHVPAGLGQDY